LALAVPLSRFTPQVGGGSAFFVRPHSHHFMQHTQHALFIQAINTKNKLSITFHSAKDSADVTRIVAPMDFGPHARFKDKSDRYHVWDFSSPSGPHTEPLEASQIRAMKLLDETFDPASFVKWTPIHWHIQRDWGQFS
jgi:hypothetical protein